VLIITYDFDGPFKWCRVDEKPAVKQFTALIFCFFCIKTKEKRES